MSEKLQGTANSFDALEPNKSNFDEIGFSHERIDILSAQYNESWLRMKGLPLPYIRKWFKWIGLEIFAKKNPGKVMMEEADRENEDYNRRQTSEFKEKWEVPFESVVSELKEKRDLQVSGAEHGHIRPVLVVHGGGIQSARSAAVLRALLQMGITPHHFEAIVGTSGGSGPAAFYATGKDEQVMEAAHLFANECTTSDFLNMMRLTQVIDTEIISKAMVSGPNALDRKAILDSSTDLYATATNAKTGISELLDMRDTGTDMQEYLKASSALPICKNAEIEINGEEYLDGAIGDFPFNELMEKYNPTSILIIANVPYNTKDMENSPLMEAIAWGLGKLKKIGSLGSLKGFEDVLNMQESTKNFFQEVYKETGVKIGVQWSPDNGLNPLSNNQDLVRSAIFDMYHRTLKDWGESPEEYDDMGSLLRSDSHPGMEIAA